MKDLIQHLCLTGQHHELDYLGDYVLPAEMNKREKKAREWRKGGWGRAPKERQWDSPKKFEEMYTGASNGIVSTSSASFVRGRTLLGKSGRAGMREKQQIKMEAWEALEELS